MNEEENENNAEAEYEDEEAQAEEDAPQQQEQEIPAQKSGGQRSVRSFQISAKGSAKSAKNELRNSAKVSVQGSNRSQKAGPIPGSLRGSATNQLAENASINSKQKDQNSSKQQPQDELVDDMGEDQDFVMPQVASEMMESDIEGNEGSSLKKKVTFTGRDKNEPKPKDYNKLRDIPFFELPKAEEDKSGDEVDDNPKIPNMIAGQTNSNKKERLSSRLKFPEEDSSSQHSGATGKSGQSKRSADSKGPLDFGEEAIAARARPEFERFYPVFKEVYKLRELNQRGYKPKGTDYFMAYLKGIKKADEERENERKKNDQKFFEQIRKVMEFQDKKAKEILERITVQDERRKEFLEEKLAAVGETLLYDFKRNKEAAKRAKLANKQNEQAYQEYLGKLGFNPTALTKAPMPMNLNRPIWELQPKGVTLLPGRG